MSYEDIKTSLYTALNEAGNLEAERLTLKQANEALKAENVKLRQEIVALTPAPKVWTVAEWLASRNFFVDGDVKRIKMSDDGAWALIQPGDLRCEVGPRAPSLAMIGRQPLSSLETRHTFTGHPLVGALGWQSLDSKVVVWQAWHTSNQNPSLSIEIVRGEMRLVHSFGGARTLLFTTTVTPFPIWEIFVYGWQPGKRTVAVWVNGARVFLGQLDLLPAGSTQGPLIKCGAYFPGWRDGQRLAEGNIVAIPTNWKAVSE